VIQGESSIEQRESQVTTATSTMDRVTEVLTIVGFSLCCISILSWLAMRASAGGQAPSILLWGVFWWVVRVTGFAGAWCALIALVLGMGSYLARRRRGEPSPWMPFVAALGLLALAFTVASVLLAHEPAYFAQGPLRPTTSQLDSLGPRDVVRAYLTSQDLAVQYSLEDAGGRASWHGGGGVPEWSLMGGATDLRITLARDKAHRDDATHRSFQVSYVTHISDNVGDPPGPQAGVINVVRAPGGQWRITDLSYGP